jgi:HD superfamily phosphohydrolase
LTPCALPAGEYPALSTLVSKIDNYLEEKYPDFFGPRGVHPVLPLKRIKVVHDNLWGTNEFSWRELAIIDSPIVQRLRNIHQVGLAYLVYPCAHHTRFEHSLGVAILASRIFDAVCERSAGEFQTIAEVLAPKRDGAACWEDWRRQLRQELRIAALLHDSGHSLFSHTSERVFQHLSVLKEACRELGNLAGKEKGAGEAISFCLAQSNSVATYLERAKQNLIGGASGQDYPGDIDLCNVALMVVGRARHPYLQFLGDIISSGFDADKLDYLLRDANAAGLPLRYDLDRYLYAVGLEKEVLFDDEMALQKLYQSVGAPALERIPPQGRARYDHYQAYRLRLPKAAMNAIEQIVICKMMLFSYLYHHPKVRAAEGSLERILKRLVVRWRDSGVGEWEILWRFLGMTDSSLYGGDIAGSDDPYVQDYACRLVSRLIPREIYHLGGDVATHADKPLFANFVTDLQDKKKSAEKIASLEAAIGEELVRLKPDLGKTPEDALCRAGVWLDVPTPPRFEDVDELMIRETDRRPGVPLMQIFPIGQWTQAYTHFRYCARIYAFSEYRDVVVAAAKTAMQRVIRIHGESFYREILRLRE